MGDHSSEPENASSRQQSSVDYNADSSVPQSPVAKNAQAGPSSQRKTSNPSLKSASVPGSRKASSAKSERLSISEVPSARGPSGESPPLQATQPAVKDPPPPGTPENVSFDTEQFVRDATGDETVVHDVPADETFVREAPVDDALEHPTTPTSIQEEPSPAPVSEGVGGSEKKTPKNSTGTDQVDGKIGSSRKSSSNIERRDSAQSRRRSSILQSSSAPVLNNAQDMKMERKESNGSGASERRLARQSMAPLQRLDSAASMLNANGSEAGSSPSPPPNLSPHKSSNATSQDIKLSIALLNADNPFNADSGRILREWSKMDNLDNVISGSKGLSRTKKQQVSRLINQIKTVTGGENSDSETEPSRISSPLQLRDGSQKLQPSGKNSRASSHHPYNVIFESDEAASIDNKSGESRYLVDDRVRDLREKLAQAALTDGLPNPDDVSNALMSIKKASDSDANRLQRILDVWYGELRQALLTENSTTRDRIVVEFDKSMRDFVKSQRANLDHLHNDVDSMQRLCRSYSKAIHKKDKAIENLAEALSGQKELTVLAKSFSGWKSEIEENRRERFLTLLANRFYHQKIVQRAWRAWRASIQDKWRQRVEKACQKRAEEVCTQMADQFDGRIAELEALVKQLREENKMYKQELEQVNAKARSALMHGVTVLKTDLATFPKSGKGDIVAESGLPSSNPDSATSENIPGSGKSDNEKLALRKQSIKTVGSGPMQYAVEKHDSSRGNSGHSSGRSEGDGAKS